MGYEKINDLSTDTVYKLGGQNPKTGKPEPKEIEGYYLGSRNVKTSAGDAVIHVFQTVKGNEGIWGTKKLNDNLTNSLKGCMTLIVYKGKKKLTGGKTQHEYDMSVDKANRINVSAETISGEAFVEEDDTDDQGADFSANAALTESRRQEVEGLLKRNRN